MPEGAFALLDCLGFKGIWKRGSSAADIISSLTAIQENSLKWKVSQLLSLDEAAAYECRIAFISDTVALSIAYQGEVELSDAQRGYMVSLASFGCVEVIRSFTAMPCAVRGCVTYGEHTVSGNFMVGEAVDEAASFYEEAQGAIVWLTPKAMRLCELHHQDEPVDEARAEALRKRTPEQMKAIFEYIGKIDKILYGQEPLRYTRRDLSEEGFRALVKDVFAMIKMPTAPEERYGQYLLEYPVPLRSGSVLNTIAVNPLQLTLGSADRELLSRLLGSFDESSLDVMVKQQQTEAFLRACILDRRQRRRRFNRLFRELMRQRRDADKG